MREAFHRDGFVLVEGLFDTAACDRLQTLLRRHADADFGAILNPDRDDFLERQSPPEARVHVAETAAALRAAMREPRMVALLDSLWERPVVGLMSQMLFKEANTRYADQAWQPHQDNNYPRSPNNLYVTINLFLEDADRENGCLYLYPGSHAEPLLPAPPTVSYRESDGRPGTPVEVPAHYEKRDLIVAKGTMLVMHGNLIHGSHANRSPDRSRPMLSMSFIPEGEPFVPGATAQRKVIPLR